MDSQTLKEKFTEVFQREDGKVFFAPGRINLIGEHTDYNGGRVFPCAITNGTYAVAALREDTTVRCYSMNFDEVGVISFELSELVNRKEDSWTNFVKGVIKYLGEAGYTVDKGFDILIYGNIPNGSGLSSSSSLELLVGVTLEHLFDFDIDRVELVKIGQRVENHFIGVNSGIMDQFAIGMAAKEQAIYLDTNTLEYELVPAEFGDNVVLIMNTKKRRELVESNYNERRSQCEEALRRLQSELDIKALGELSVETFEANRHLIGDDVLERRAKHAVYENERTKLAKEALTSGDLERFGQLLNESHISLRDDYEVTGLELDTLVHTAWEQPGVLGARMTGAGMGGCAIALVNKDKVDAVQTEVQAVYEQTVGYPAEFYVAQVGDGARALEA
ncbi:galactokinase [Tuanshanicoccus lijuaniae]|uniref:galactokinase n=1 Tax=Aerococcaceae bacterium zg-1292 TaxID=2774330 RepID=UPI001936DF51|nr:galactokinase [Aerococcaceae bacterium zg-1292]MBF6978172.1 galactokinase [Aerococcaceae bacterium zg-BR22]QQA37540.1 galactokinase [Aerococcaceae bacterium zg-1292]